MIENDKYDVTDLIINAAEQKPVEFEATFDSLLKDRLTAAVENRKQEIASMMFNPSEVIGEPEE
jgi:hypothetical protein